MDEQRARWVGEAMRQAGYSALVCRLPQNLVLLTGYQPILGNSFAVVTVEGDGALRTVRLVVPEDEADLVPAGTAVEMRTFSEETLDSISTTIPSVRAPLDEMLRAAGVANGALVGYEGGNLPVAAYYTQIGLPGETTVALLRDLLPGAHLHDATDLLEELAATKTDGELARIREAEELARIGFDAARATIQIGVTEAEVAAAVTQAMLAAGYALPGAHHITPHVHVMAGVRSAWAYKAFNLTSNYALQRGDPVSVQLEIAIDGYWAELTRPFFSDVIGDTWRTAHAACLHAQDAALRVIRAGATGKAADAAARDVLTERGLGQYFKHGLGHGFGFQAINHAAQPILHPASRSVLAAGMVCNMEPAVYIEGHGGMRLNDDVLVLAEGNELLSRAIPRDLEYLVVKERSAVV
ncbi:MAG TPA: Xaa-Pro peptidase family protein [Ktedonobacterales bacterium]